MPDNKQNIGTPSAFWGIGGTACVLLSLATALLLVFAAGALIGGAIVGLLGVTAGLVCMGIGVAKNSSAIDNIRMNVGHAAEKQQTSEQNHSQSNDIHAGNACISKKMVDCLKSTMLNK